MNRAPLTASLSSILLLTTFLSPATALAQETPALAQEPEDSEADQEHAEEAE